jgi:ABC-2 type transport system permease protein
MNKILLIIQREYLSRVKKKSFIIMTFLTPLLIAIVYAIIGYFAYKGIEGTHEKVAVINHNKTITDVLKTDKNTAYNYLDIELDDAKKLLGNSDYDYVLYLPEFSLDKPSGIELIGKKQAGLSVSERIARDLETLIKNQKLKALGISAKDLADLKVNVHLSTKNIGDGGQEQESNAGIATIIGSVAGVLMFMFIMIYGAQVMRGVIEEKTSRIIEVIISSVRPFQLMMGKIIGIALVGLTQFLLWIVLTFAISSVATQLLVDKQDVKKIASAQIQQKLPQGIDKSTVAIPTDDDSFAAIQKGLSGIEFGKIISVFLFFFLGGYLFYSALYAAIGSAVDNETETQQFMLPVMMPLLLGYALSLSVVNSNPHGSLSFWLSIIPFTSPIAMVVRMPYGVPGWELALSAVLLIIGFVATVWLAGKIYRVGILMYGKKTSYKEIVKWLKYKN